MPGHIPTYADLHWLARTPWPDDRFIEAADAIVEAAAALIARGRYGP